MICMVGAYEGMKIDEILKLNDHTFRAQIKEYWNFINPCKMHSFLNEEIQKKGEEYFLTEEYKKTNKNRIPIWREEIKETLKSKKNKNLADLAFSMIFDDI